MLSGAKIHKTFGFNKQQQVDFQLHFVNIAYDYTFVEAFNCFKLQQFVKDK